LVLENIENNFELDMKPSSRIKVRGAGQKRKMELMDSHIPKKPKRVGWTDKHCMLCNKHGGLHKTHNTHDCHQLTRMVLLSKGMGTQLSPMQRKRRAKV